MKIIKATKTYRGGSKDYYLWIGDQETCDENMLERLGRNTSGGENNGYEMKATEIDELPEGEKILNRTRTIYIY